MYRILTAVLLLVCVYSGCDDGIGMNGTPEYQAKKAEEDRKAAEARRVFLPALMNLRR